MSKDEKDTPVISHYVFESLIIVPLLLLVNHFRPSSFSIPLFQHWTFTQDALMKALTDSIPIFIWAFSYNCVVCCFKNFKKKENPKQVLKYGFLTSLFAGVVEEYLFRWVFFYSVMIGIQISCFLFFGFISSSLEIPRLFYEYIGQPITNFFTFGLLSWVFVKPTIISFSILASNATFRDGHKYQGFIGYINSWIIGFYLFWIMFNYGLIAAMIIHFTYNFIIDLIVFVCMTYRNSTSSNDDNLGTSGRSSPRNPSSPSSLRAQ
jgi:hypothetical protein